MHRLEQLIIMLSRPQLQVEYQRIHPILLRQRLLRPPLRLRQQAQEQLQSI